MSIFLSTFTFIKRTLYFSEPLSNVPVDLLFLHLVLPYTMHYFRPKKVVKDVAASVWKFLATRLRLTSYFFGGRHPREEFSPKNWRDNFVREAVHVVDEGDIANGSFRRVPAVDNVALPRDMRATVSVNAEGEPVDDEAKELMELQNAEAEKAKRNVKVDFMIVYIPPHFRYRIICFIALLWMFGSVMLGLSVALPITLGRSFFRLFTARDIHDGYSFIVGFYLVWMCYIIGKAVDRLDKRRQRRSGDGPRANLHVLVLKRGLLWVAKTIYMAFFLGIIIPILLAVVIDLYIILPIRLEWDPAMTPRIRVVDAWALGLLYAKIAMYAHRIEPPNRITRGLQHVSQRPLVLSILASGAKIFEMCADHDPWVDAPGPYYGHKGGDCASGRWFIGHDSPPRCYFPHIAVLLPEPRS